MSENTFQGGEDDDNPDGFAPFNVQGIGPNIYVTYAKQDAARHDPVAGAGLGFVKVFDSNGKLIQRLETTNSMNAPWGVVLATQDFGEFSHTILVGQFRSGNISAFNPVTGRFLGNMLNPGGPTLQIDGLRALRFGNDGAAGPATTLNSNACLKSIGHWPGGLIMRSQICWLDSTPANTGINPAPVST